MVRQSFDRQLADLQDEVIVLGNMVDRAIDQSIEALRNLDREHARRIIEDDKLINRKRFDIEEMCLHLIARQQPLASDLRIIAAILSIIIDLERMGDHAQGIAKPGLQLCFDPV